MEAVDPGASKELHPLRTPSFSGVVGLVSPLFSCFPAPKPLPEIQRIVPCTCSDRLSSACRRSWFSGVAPAVRPLPGPRCGAYACRSCTAAVPAGSHACSSSSLPGSHACSSSSLPGSHACSRSSLPGPHACSSSSLPGPHTCSSSSLPGPHACSSSSLPGPHACSSSSLPGPHTCSSSSLPGPHACSSSSLPGPHACSSPCSSPVFESPSPVV
ncbi:mucin-1-like [Nothobranchius furzeri]|uniref:mucin-1-like n=1 Tax=Nothobranchius furzeri TaxID=105023 RepID=UPI003904D14E